ncbi:hypothetical protein F0L68_10060 [Solihabitans fulvus]|uniref:DUF6292 domain-containing protein n=1 Tax=Solihabitans fulvus TaxID=1892852 RepID=A0A5B2XKE6_9PSEU|nr:DUF6292 family protein [Solihabitans fulvus]KAA2263370.1 hypothetical protein F0L68_10060 [Solihabitans fulvus]
MDLEYEGAPARGLRRYVRLVAEALGLDGGGYFVQLESPAHAYIALERRLPARPDRDVALTWTEGQGWALASESADGDELSAHSVLGGDVLPAPRVVAQFVRRVCEGAALGEPAAPPVGAEELASRLTAYAGPGASHGLSPDPATAASSRLAAPTLPARVDVAEPGLVENLETGRQVSGRPVRPR